MPLLENESIDHYKKNIAHVKLLQSYFRARYSYKLLAKKQGQGYKRSLFTHEQFEKQSEENIKLLIKDLKVLTPEELNFFYFFIDQDFELSHYTGDYAKHKILESGQFLSNKILDKRHGKRGYVNNSDFDATRLGNGGFVFFRFELEHQQIKNSRFGDNCFVVKGRTSGLLENGWVSLYETIRCTHLFE